MIKIGAHQSIAKGYVESLKRIKNIGGNCLQIFSSSPRSFSFTRINQQQVVDFIELKNKLKIDPIYFHASYLINLADIDRIGKLSKNLLINEFKIASLLQIRGSIIHLGSFKNYLPQEQNMNKYQALISNIKEVLEKTPKNSLFIIENSGNRKIGQSLEEISQITKDVNNDRVRLCLDTCHLFSSGYKFENIKELDTFLAKLVKLKLIDKLECWHVNDSRDAFNSGHDRHANIGTGNLSINEFKTLLNHKITKNYPFIIETPGFDNKGPDKKNIDILKNMYE